MMQDQKPEDVIFFDGQDLVVVGKLFPSPERLVINFSSRINSGKAIVGTAEELLQRPADTVFEGESFFAKRGIPAVYFVARRNDWYQSKEVWEAIKTLENFNLWDKYQYITTYGLSMGAYGALLFSKAVRANRVIAVAPQYSIDSRVVPFETRWLEDRERITFQYDDMADGLIQDGEVIVFYDRFFDFDKRHVDMISAHRPLEKFLVNFSTHTVARALNDMGIFSQIMERLFNRQLNKKEFSDWIRAARQHSPLLLHNMARTVQQKGRDNIASVLFARAVDVMEERLKVRPDAYHKPYSALSSIRVLENHVKELISAKKITADELARVQRLVDYYILPRSYSTWNVMKASAAVALGLYDEAQEALEAIDTYLKAADLPKVLAIYVQLLAIKPDVEKVLSIQQRFAGQIAKNDTLNLHMASMLLLVNLKEQALSCFEQVLGSQVRPDISVTHRQALVGIARCSSLDEALARYDQVLGHDSSGPNYQKVKNAITRLAR